MSVTSIVILFSAITSLQHVGVVAKKSAYELLVHAPGKGALGWSKDAFSSRQCKEERQPVVEFWHLSGLQYLFFSQRVTWAEGRMLCLNYNARLAILDDMEKAVAVARSIAQSNIEMQDSWIGGRRVDFVWTWTDADTGPGKKTEIPMEPNVEDFPPWTREPSRATKECLAVDRRSHDHPNFIDLDCRLQRPFICEKKSEESIGSPVPSKWIQIHRNTYTLYHAKVTWHEAATFCRAQGTRLAILKTSTVINILTNSMTKTRPDFEAVWIGAHFSYGQWIWMATGSLLNPLTDESGYPPWRFGRPEKNDGCLLLDRHIEDSTNFIEATCDRKRDFVCEEYPEEEDEDWLNEPAKFTHGNSTYIIYPLDKSWSNSRNFCNERGSILAHVGSIETLNLIIEAMGDHPREIRHVWLGGHFKSKTDQWHWIDNDEEIPKLKNEVGFPPWARIDTGLDHDPASSACLNLDRSDHVKPHFYGLDCASKQPFVCKITCDVPPIVKHGTWQCYDLPEGRECSLQCDMGLMIMGVRNVTCTSIGGWVTGLHWLEFPLCLEPKEYTTRMIRSVSHDIQKSAGYYVVLDHLAPVMHLLSLKLADRLVKAFPVSRNLQMGMTCYGTVPPTHVAFNQTDNCAVLEVINSMETAMTNVAPDGKNDISTFYNDVSMFNGRRILIIAIIDSKRAPDYADAIDQFKSSGHHVTVIGLEEDWKMLLPLATVGYDRRSNLFLFDETELEKIIDLLDKMEQKPSKCKISTTTSTTTTTTTEQPEILSPTTLETTEEEANANSEDLIFRGLGIQHGIDASGNNSNTNNSSVSSAGAKSSNANLESTASTIQTAKETSDVSEQKLTTSEEQSKTTVDGEKHDANLTKNEEGLPRIYSEQASKRDVSGASQEREESQISVQTLAVAKDSSSEATENFQDQERIAVPSSSTIGRLNLAAEEGASSLDGNDSAK